MPRHAARGPRRTLLLRSAIGLAGALVVAERVPAADRSWGNTAGGTFSTTTNWINGIVAGVNDVAVFDRSRGTSQTTYTVSFGASAQNQAVRVSNDLVTFSLNGRTYTTTQITGNEIGTSSSTSLQARLTINNGTFNATGLLTPQLLVGAAPGATGALTLTNNGVLAGSPRLLVGTGSATGNFTVNAGTATLNTLDVGSGVGGRGNAFVTLPFSAVTTGTLLVGNAGTGTMTVNTSAALTANGPATIGNLSGSSGFVNVDNSRWTQTGPLLVGNAGAGTINVLSAGRLISSTTVMGSTAGSSATVRVDGPGSGSQWTNSGTLIVGDRGNATLEIGGGGLVSAAVTDIASGTGSVGNANLSGAGSSATFTRLFVGVFGNATCNVTGGAVLNAGTQAALGVATGSIGTMNISGPGSSVNCDSFFAGFNGRGTLNISDGGRLTSTGNAELGSGFDSNRFGQVNVSGPGSSWVNSGTIDLDFQGKSKLKITGGGTVQCSGISVDGFFGLDVDGAGSRFVNTGTMSMFGSLSVTNGGVVENTASSLTTRMSGDDFCSVSGVGSRWINAGTLLVDAFDAGLQVSSGAQVLAGNTLVERDGSLTVQANATLTTSRLAVGSVNGGGTFTVQFGGRAQSTSGEVTGHNTASFTPVTTARISSFGSGWQNDGTLIIGGMGSAPFFGEARMEVSGGGTVSNQDAFIAMSPTSIGTVTVGGSGTSWTTSGNLYVGGSTLSAGGSGTLIINSGGSVTVTDTLTVWNDGVVNLNGGSLAVGSMSFPGSTFNFASGMLRFAGPVQLNGAYLDKLLGPPHVIGPLKHLSIAGTPTLTAPLTLDGGILTVPGMAAGSPFQFDGGTFNLTSDNLTIGSGGLLGGSVTLDDRNINVTNSTTIQPGAQLTLQGGSFVSGGGITNDGQFIIQSPSSPNFQSSITNNGELRVATGVSAQFRSSLTGSGSLTGGGSKFFRTGSNSAFGEIDSSGTSTVDPGATLAARRIREDSMFVSGNVRIDPGGTDASTSRLNFLSVNVGQFDLADNALVINYTGTSPLTAIAARLQSGFAGGSWNGVGINSSVAASQGDRALGLAEATDIGSPATFAGEAIDATSLLVRFTLPGDANLDRSVNIGDFSLLAANFNVPGYWARGDFNYDGTAGIGDFALLAANFNQSLPATPANRGGTVPEPAAAVLVLLAGAISRHGRHDRTV